MIFFSVIIPFAYVLFRVSAGKITDIHVAMREQRKGPFVVALLGSIAALVSLFLSRAPVQIIEMSVALLLNGSIFLILSRKWKLSIHSATFASAVTIAAIMADNRIFWLYILIIPIFWARMYRKKHTLLQLVAAAFLSAVTTAIILYIFR